MSHSDGASVILIQTIGDVTGYKRVKYVDPDSGNEYETFMTLGFFTKRFNVNKLIVIGLESTLTVSRTIYSKDMDYYNHVFECLEKLGESGLVVDKRVWDDKISITIKPPEKVNSYREWVGLVEKYYNCFIRHKLVGYTGDVSYIILPVKAHNIQGYSYGLSNVQLSKTLLLYGLYRHIKARDGDLKIILDVTHGLNYIIANTIDAIRMLVPVFGMNVEVWNAIPVGGDIYEMQYIYKLLAKGSSIDLSIDTSKLRDRRKRAFIEALKRNGILAIYYLCRDRDGERELVDYYGEWINNRIIKNNRIEEGGFRYSPEEVYVDIIYKHICDRVGKNMLKDMQDWGHKVFEAVSPSSDKIVNKELNDIFNNYMCKLASGSSSIYDKPGVNKIYDKDNKDDVERNFIAHAGLLYGTVMLTKDGDDLRLDYCRECKDILNKVIDGLGEVIEKYGVKCGDA